MTQKRLKAVERSKKIRLIQHPVKKSLEKTEELRTAAVVEIGPGSKPQVRQLRPLISEEQDFIRNERVVCALDFRYWLERYHHILHWEDQSYQLMTPNVAQDIVLDVIGEMEERKVAVKLQTLKARQLGITTLMGAIIEHRTMFYPNTKSIVGSATPEKSGKMVKMQEDSWDRMPWWLMPQMTVRKAGEMIEFGELGSNLSIRHGAQKGTDVGRGETPTIAHLSEIVDWANPEQDINAGLLFAMHPSQSMLIVLESTAGYIGDWWHKEWEYNKAHLGDLSLPPRLYPLFLPWFIGRDIYPTEAELRDNPIPSGWVPAELTRQHAKRAAEYVRNSPLLRKHLGLEWAMPLEQQWYWEYTRNYFKEIGELNVFLREMPANDVEAFNSKYSSVFDAEVIEHYSLAANPPERIYALDGPLDEIRPELKPDVRQIDKNLKPLVIKVGPQRDYTLYPLKKDGYPSSMNPEGKIFMWELPQDECTYGLGVDTSKGIGQDSSVICALRKATMDKVARQVCEFAHSHVSANDLPPWVHAIASLYKVKREGELYQPKLVIETNNGGDATQLAMKKLGWVNYHNWIRLDKKVLDESKANFHGFVMVEWARDLVVGGALKALKDYMIDIESPWLIREMATLEKNEEKARIEAGGKEAHDDRFMAFGMVLASLHALNWGSLKSPFGKSRVSELEEKIQLTEEIPVYAVQAQRKNWTEVAQKVLEGEDIPAEWREEGYGEGEWQDIAPIYRP
jgi:hypothetical protein